MGSNSRQRSASSDSRKHTSRNKNASVRPSSIKGRPSQSRSVRMPQGSAYSRARVRSYSDANQQTKRVSHDAYRRPSANAGGVRGTGGRSDARGYDPVRSVSVSQVRDASRMTKQKAPSRFRGIVIAILIIAAVLGIAGVVVYHLDLFPVSKVTVSGADHLTAEEMTELTAVPQDTTLIRVDTAGIESRLKSNPWVKEASVERVFPDTINLKITEREITAIVEVLVDDSKTTQTWALASDGMWLMKIPDRNSDEGKQLASTIYEEVDSKLKISQVPYGSVPEAGTICKNANISNALSIIDGMTTDLASQVKQVTASSSESTTLILNNGIEIAFGDSSNLRDKERVCLELMEEYPNQISYINVRVVNKPVWRSV